MEPPSTKTRLRSFLGIWNVYRKFVKKHFATIATPLNKLLKKTVSDSIETLTKDQQQSFETPKQRLVSPPILALPRAYIPNILDKDANAEQIICVPAQWHGTKDLRPIGYFSKTLTDTERNYDTTERECLDIIWDVILLRPHFEGTRFTLQTDHDPLKWLFGEQATGKTSQGRLGLQ